MRITWTDPYSNSGTLNGFKVFIADFTGTFLEEDVYCNGLVDPVFSQRYCEVPMSVLISSPYYLPFNTIVQAEIQARNQYGYGPLSPANTGGAQIQTQPSTVSGLARGSFTNTSEVQISWNALTSQSDTGGSTILSYELSWDAGTNQTTWTTLVGYSSPYNNTSYIVTTGIVAGQSYYFRVRAQNFWGWSGYS